MLLPPHAAGKIVATIIRRHIAQYFRRLVSRPVKTQPSRPSGIHAAESLAPCSNQGAAREADKAVALTIRVALPAGVAEFGEMLQVGIGEGPLTVHVSAIVPEKPPCAGNVNTSLTCPPRFMVRIATAGFSEKSGGGFTVTVTSTSLFVVNISGASEPTCRLLARTPAI